MKKLAGGLVFFWLAGLISIAQTVAVYDIAVTPDNSNKKVTVNYRLNATNGGLANVGMNISSNAGESWTVPANTFYPGSDVGPGIPADGTQRQLVWDARTDWNNQYSTQMMVRLNATSSELQSGLYWGVGDKIYRMNLDGSACTLICSGWQPVTMFLDVPRNRLVFDLWDSGSPVKAYNLASGGAPTTLYSGPSYGGGQGLVFDPTTRQIFMGLYYDGLYVLNENSTPTWQQLVTSSQLSPMHGEVGQMALDPVHQQIYFRSPYNGSCDACRWIWRVNYDGSGLTQITPAQYGWGLALDLDAGHIYFSDGPPDGPIMRVNLDGSNRQTVLTTPTEYNFCAQIILDKTHDTMYLYQCSTSNWRRRTVAKAGMDGSNFTVLKTIDSSIDDGWGLVLFQP